MAPDFDCELPKPALNGGCGEREIVQLRNGSLLAIIRSDRGGRKVSALSHDSGVTWVNQRQTTMQEPSCEGSLMQLDDAASTLLFAASQRSACGPKAEDGALRCDALAVDQRRDRLGRGEPAVAQLDLVLGACGDAAVAAPAAALLLERARAAGLWL